MGHSQQNFVDHTTKTIVQEAKRYIEENYQNSDLSLETLCDHLHMSTAYFSTVFKKTGIQ